MKVFSGHNWGEDYWHSIAWLACYAQGLTIEDSYDNESGVRYLLVSDENRRPIDSFYSYDDVWKYVNFKHPNNYVTDFELRELKTKTDLMRYLAYIHLIMKDKKLNEYRKLVNKSIFWNDYVIRLNYADVDKIDPSSIEGCGLVEWTYPSYCSPFYHCTKEAAMRIKLMID